MNRELAVYLRIQASVSAAFSFFIGGMAAALIYHKADFVPADAISNAIDITITCLLTFAITTPFCRASLRRDKTGGVLAANACRPGFSAAPCCRLYLSACAPRLFYPL